MSSNSMWKQIIRGVVVAALLLLVAAAPALTQVTGALLSGTVTDASGAIILGAAVTVQNTGTGAVRHDATDAKGFYTAANLQPGSYKVTIAAQGFVSQVSNLTLTVGQQQVLNASLKIGSTAQSVEVTATAPSVQLSSSSVSSTVNSQTMRELPLNGRSWTDLATLQPGVSNPQDQPPFNGGRGQRGFGNQISITGRRPQDNSYRIDGISAEDYMNGGPGNVEGGALGVDAIQEFSVLTGTYPAEYGMSTGGVINAITRSGTNSFHGSAYEFLRNDALDARNFFDTQKPPFRRNQFGASLGGPIWRNKTFVFADYEAIRENQALTTVDVVPTQAARVGDAAAVKYLNAFFPLPNGAVTGNTGVYSFAGARINTENFFTGRLDHHFSASDTLSATMVLDNNNLNSPDEFNAKRATFQAGHKLGQLQWTHVFSPNLVNSAQIGIYRTPAQVGTTTGVLAAASDTSFASIPGRNAPDIKIAGLTEFTGGVGAPSFYNFHYNTIQVNDDMFYTAGAHSIKFGYAYERIRDNVTAVTDGNGVFNFGSLSDFLSNKPKSFKGAFPSAVSGRSVRQTVFGTYVEDDWRWSPQLTVNIGVRYEFATIPTETHGKLSILPTLDSPLPVCEVPIAGCQAAPHAYLFSNPTTKDFEPRIGLAWDPFGNGRTAVRAGFGIYDTLPLPYLYNLEYVFTAPFFKEGINNALPLGSFPTLAFSTITAGSNTLRQAYQDPHPKRSYVLQYTLDVQHQITDSLALMLAYVGSGGVHEPFRAEEANRVPPTVTPAGLLWPAPVGSGTKVNPFNGVIRGLYWRGKSNYNALESHLEKRLSHGVQMSVAYTWSKDIDLGTSAVAGDTFANSIAGLLSDYMSANRGPSDLNVTQSFIFSGLWNAPAGTSLPAAARFVAGGWQVGGVVRASTGVPFTPVMAGDPLGQNGDHSFDVPNVLGSAPGCSSLVNPGNPNQYIKTQCFAVPNPINLRGNASRNMLTGPSQFNLDVSLVKNFAVKALSDSSNLQFRAEAFNILNHANFAPPVDNNALFDQSGAPIATAGLIDSTASSSRQIQLALKLTF